VTEDRTGTPPATDPAVGDGLDALTEEVLPALIARLRGSRLGELEVSTPSWRVRLRREPAATVGGTQTSASALAYGAPEGEDISIARSPAVGYFMPGPNLVLGRSVQSGDALGGVDVLGIVQDVIAASDGVVSRVSAETGQAVEYGQALAEIDPFGAGLGLDDEVVD
jgi:biotin carboxyl carrier protein